MGSQAAAAQCGVWDFPQRCIALVLAQIAACETEFPLFRSYVVKVARLKASSSSNWTVRCCRVEPIECHSFEVR